MKALWGSEGGNESDHKKECMESRKLHIEHIFSSIIELKTKINWNIKYLL